MDNKDLLDEIDKWNLVFSSHSTIDPSLYELAFFKIFIKFEKFLSDCFENYAIGISSSFGYCPNRRLNFDDIEHLHKVIKKDNQSFINHWETLCAGIDFIRIFNSILFIKHHFCNYCAKNKIK